MSANELDYDPTVKAVREARLRPRIILHWEKARLESLHAKASAAKIADFEAACARGQLAAAGGNIDEAEQVLLSTLREFRHLYPVNAHFFTSIVQLALAMQALELVALFLNDRHEVKEFFEVTFKQSTDNPMINVVTVDSAGTCHFSIDPRIPGAEHADYFVGHWLSSTPLWVSYCRTSGWQAGTTLMNSGEHGGAPGLAYCANKPEHILIPDAYFLNSRGYRNLRSRYDAIRPEWSSRSPIAFWRGSTTGIRTGDRKWQSLPRIQLSQISIQNPSLLDAGISSVVQTQCEQEKLEMNSAGLVRGPVPEDDFVQFRYQIDIDGNSNSWPGLYQKLLTGSPVLKIASPHGFRQWYYDRLVPWVNYVPVDSDMSDLVSKIEWLKGHDDDAQSIGRAGLALAKSLEYDVELTLAHQKILAAFRTHSFSVFPNLYRQELPKKDPNVSTSEATAQNPVLLTRQSDVMRALYGRDIWSGYIVARAAENAVQGWNGNHPSFRRLLLAAPQKTFIDLGVWKGQSTIYVAKAMRELGIDGCVISVDTFLGSVEHWGLDGKLFDWRIGRPDLYETFCSNVISHGVSDLVVPMPQTSRAAAQILRGRNITAGVIHVDASHEYEDVQRDLQDFWPLVAPGGFLVGDDYHSSWPGVMKAADEFAAKLAIPLQIDLPKFILQKPANVKVGTA